MEHTEHIQYSRGEEAVNAITHGAAAVLSLVGLIVLVVLAGSQGDPWRIVSFSIYGASLVSLFLISALYHGIPLHAAKRVLRRFDHASIYLLIAGTYTPFMLVPLRGGWGWSILSIVWGLAALGIALEVIFARRLAVLEMVLYLGMGWLGVVAIKPALALLPPGGFLLLALGGVLYTTGVVFYLWKRIPFNHAIWHVFVIAASACHFAALAFFVLPV
jgi:hemolysin III